MVVAVESTQNRKTGPLAATYVSQSSCPESCPFFGNGCYAETGHMLHTTRRVNAKSGTPEEIATEEAKKIVSLSGMVPLRLHVVGDAKTDEAAKILANACKTYSARFGQPAFTYTHAWRDVLRSSWGQINVLASCENAEQVMEANEKGYAAAVVVEKFESDKVYEKDGLKILPCPQQTGRVKNCVECRACMKADKLKQTGLTVAFEAHGASKRKVIRVVNGDDGKE
jgi:hypothetical protein